MTLKELQHLFAQHLNNGVYREISTGSVYTQLVNGYATGLPFMLTVIDIHDELIDLAINIDDVSDEPISDWEQAGIDIWNVTHDDIDS